MARHHFIIGLVIDLDDKTVRMEIIKGHYFETLSPLHQYVLDALGFEQGTGPVYSYKNKDAVMLHSKLAAAVIGHCVEHAESHVCYQAQINMICSQTTRHFYQPQPTKRKKFKHERCPPHVYYMLICRSMLCSIAPAV